jgi:uncharacterized membrane protein (UPF0127 family)
LQGWFNVNRENASVCAERSIGLMTVDKANAMLLLGLHELQTQAMLLVVVFFAAELTPIYLTLDKRLLAMLSVENYEPLLENSEIYR